MVHIRFCLVWPEKLKVNICMQFLSFKLEKQLYLSKTIGSLIHPRKCLLICISQSFVTMLAVATLLKRFRKSRVCVLSLSFTQKERRRRAYLIGHPVGPLLKRAANTDQIRLQRHAWWHFISTQVNTSTLAPCQPVNYSADNVSL